MQSASIPPAACMVPDWGATLLKHQTWLRHVIRCRLGEAAGVEDVWQEVVVAATRQAARLMSLESLEPWLYRVALRQTLLYRRKAGRQRRLQSAWALHAMGRGNPHGMEPLVYLMAAERNDLVREALTSLPPREAQILLLKYVENWSYAEIAKHLGITVMAVESRLFRARARMRARLAPATLEKGN